MKKTKSYKKYTVNKKKLTKRKTKCKSKRKANHTHKSKANNKKSTGGKLDISDSKKNGFIVEIDNYNIPLHITFENAEIILRYFIFDAIFDTIFDTPTNLMEIYNISESDVQQKLKPLFSGDKIKLEKLVISLLEKKSYMNPSDEYINGVISLMNILVYKLVCPGLFIKGPSTGGGVGYSRPAEDIQILAASKRRFVVVFNSGNKFICKIATNPDFIEAYEMEYNMYVLLENIKPYAHLESFFGWQTGAAEISDIIPIILDFTYEGIPFFKEIDLYTITDPTNIEDYQDEYGQTQWGSLNGVYNPYHVDFDIVISDPNNTHMFDAITSRPEKINTGIELIFDNLEVFYTRCKFIHGDFKTNNALVNVDDSYTNITEAIMFDLDQSYIHRGPEGEDREKLNRVLSGMISINNNLQAIDYIMFYTMGFCHFFDCFFFAITFYVNSLNKPIVNTSPMTLPWHPDDLHSLNIFKTCYNRIKFKGIRSLSAGGDDFYNVTLIGIINIMTVSSKALFDSLEPIERVVIKWIFTMLDKCEKKRALPISIQQNIDMTTTF